MKWKKRSFTKDADMGPKQPKSTVLTKEEEAIIVAFRKHTLLPLEGVFSYLFKTPSNIFFDMITVMLAKLAT